MRIYLAPTDGNRLTVTVTTVGAGPIPGGTAITGFVDNGPNDGAENPTNQEFNDEFEFRGTPSYFRTADISQMRNKYALSQQLDFDSSTPDPLNGQPPVADSKTRFSTMSPVFAPPFSPLGNCFDTTNKELQQYGELLPGVNDCEISLKIIDGENIVRNWLNLGMIDAGGDSDILLKVSDLKITLIAQYSRLSIPPIIPNYYPVVGVEVYKGIMQETAAGNEQAFAFPNFRLGRVPKYLIISVKKADVAPLWDKSANKGTIGSDAFVDMAYARSNHVKDNRGHVNQTKQYAVINDISLSKAQGGDVLFRKSLNASQLHFISKRSSPAKNKYPFDLGSYLNGKRTVLIDTSLCGLKGKLPNENDLFNILVSGTYQNTFSENKIFQSKLICIYTNYAYHNKSSSFDFVEKHL